MCLNIKISKCVVCNKTNISNVQPLEVVGRHSETQLQVTEHLNKIVYRINGYKRKELNQCWLSVGTASWTSDQQSSSIGSMSRNYSDGHLNVSVDCLHRKQLIHIIPVFKLYKSFKSLYHHTSLQEYILKVIYHPLYSMNNFVTNKSKLPQDGAQVFSYMG